MNTKHEKFKKNQSHSTAMSLKTKEFLKRICYKETVTVDMTQNGFIRDSKEHIFQLLENKFKNENKMEPVTKHITSSKVVTRKQLLESNGHKHKGPKVIPRKHRFKLIDDPNTKSKNSSIQAPPRK